MRGRWLTVLLPLLGACAHLPGPTAQLQRFKEFEAAKNLSAIEAESVNGDCIPDASKSDACPQIYEIRGRACMQLVRDETAPGAACPAATETARRRLDCAVADFGAAKSSGAFSSDQLAEITEMHARALYCSANLRTPAEGVPMAKDAVADLNSLPPNPRRDQLAAAAELYIANREQLPAQQRCDAAHEAARLAERGLTANPSAEIAEGLRGARRGAQSVAARIAGCGGL